MVWQRTCGVGWLGRKSRALDAPPAIAPAVAGTIRAAAPATASIVVAVKIAIAGMVEMVTPVLGVVTTVLGVTTVCCGRTRSGACAFSPSANAFGCNFSMRCFCDVSPPMDVAATGRVAGVESRTVAVAADSAAREASAGRDKMATCGGIARFGIGMVVVLADLDCGGSIRQTGCKGDNDIVSSVAVLSMAAGTTAFAVNNGKSSLMLARAGAGNGP